MNSELQKLIELRYLALVDASRATARSDKRAEAHIALVDALTRAIKVEYQREKPDNTLCDASEKTFAKVEDLESPAERLKKARHTFEEVETEIIKEMGHEAFIEEQKRLKVLYDAQTKEDEANTQPKPPQPA